MTALGDIRAGRWDEVLGMNARTRLVDAENPPEAVHLVNSKCATKEVLEAASIPVSETLVLLKNRFDLAGLDWGALPEGWALKPNFGSQGAGIMLAAGRDGDGWRTGSGRPLSRGRVKDHLRFILDGEFWMESVESDWAFFEPLIEPHPDLKRLVPTGLPDVRLICRGPEVLLAMMRLPTEASGGKANLHRGAVGAALDLRTGVVTRARVGREPIEHHLDTGGRILGAEVPFWDDIVEMARRCGPATGLGYLGVDVVVDAGRGPLVLEVNARPGLEIQNVTGAGLAPMLRNGA